MFKRLHLLLTLSLTFFGTVNLMAEDLVYKTLTFSDTTFNTSISSYTATWENTVDGATWTLENFNNNNKKWEYVKCGRRKTQSYASITNNTAFEPTITKLVISLNAANNVNNATLLVSTDNTFPEGEQTQSIDLTSSFNGISSQVDVTCVIPTPQANSFYKLSIDNNDQAGANGSVVITKIVYYYQDLSKTSTTLTFAEGDKSFLVGATEGTTFTNVATLNPAIEGATVTYESDNENIAVVESDGSVLVVTDAIGDATITASYAGNDDYAPSTAQYKIRVRYPIVGAGVESDPYTVRDIVQLVLDGNVSNTYVKGTIKEVTEISSNYHNATYTITDGANDIIIYRGKSFASNNMDYDYQLLPGDEIVISGSATLYNGTTPEMTQNNTVVSQTRTRTTTANKFGTICLPYAGAVTGGTFYSVEGIENGTLNLTEVSAPQAGEPYIFQANDEKMTIAFVAGAPAEAGTTAYLVGVATNTEAIPGTYLLQTIDGVQKFRIVADVKPTIPAGRAYLKDAAAGGREFIDFGGTTTAINALEAITNNKAEIYDLNGRKLNKLQKGVNIVNGTKVVVK